MTAIPRTGVWLFPEAPAPALVAAVVQSEALGLDELWLGDEGPAREPFAVLAAASQATNRIRLGIGITNPYVRPPALTTTSALTIHELSEGRVILGVGAGGQLSLAPFRLEATHPIDRVEGFLATARAVCAGVAAPDYEPAKTSITSAATPTPMPLYVGGRGPRINRLASAAADGAFVAGLPPFRYETVIGWVREHRPVDVALYPSVAFDDEAIEHHRPEMIWSLLDAPSHVAESLGVDPGELGVAADALRRGDRRPASALVNDELLGHLMLVGAPAEIGSQLADLVRRHAPTSIGLALLQPEIETGIDDAAAALAAMRRNLEDFEP